MKSRWNGRNGCIPETGAVRRDRFQIVFKENENARESTNFTTTELEFQPAQLSRLPGMATILKNQAVKTHGAPAIKRYRDDVA
jgi:hypothetical protein